MRRIYEESITAENKIEVDHRYFNDIKISLIVLCTEGVAAKLCPVSRFLWHFFIAFVASSSIAAVLDLV